MYVNDHNPRLTDHSTYQQSNQLANGDHVYLRYAIPEALHGYKVVAALVVVQAHDQGCVLTHFLFKAAVLPGLHTHPRHPRHPPPPHQ